MSEDENKDLNKQILSSILSRLDTLEKEKAKLEADNRALQAQVSASKPKSPMEQVIETAKKDEELKQNIAAVRKNFPIGIVVLECLKRDLIKRTEE